MNKQLLLIVSSTCISGAIALNVLCSLSDNIEKRFILSSCAQVSNAIGTLLFLKVKYHMQNPDSTTTENSLDLQPVNDVENPIETNLNVNLPPLYVVNPTQSNANTPYVEMFSHPHTSLPQRVYRQQSENEASTKYDSGPNFY